MKPWFCLTGLALTLSMGWAHASGLDQLQAFLSQASRGDYTFEQTVTGPSTRASKPVVQKGRMRFIRPHKFRFDYGQPFPQVIVADGRKLWLYDPDLAQVTVRDQAITLAESPAGLLASATDLKELEIHFVLSTLPSSDGLEWVLAVPKNGQAVLTQVKVGLKSNRLAALELTDAMGQRARLNFSLTAMDQEIVNSVFQFTPPAGTDLLQQ